MHGHTLRPVNPHPRMLTVLGAAAAVAALALASVGTGTASAKVSGRNAKSAHAALVAFKKYDQRALAEVKAARKKVNAYASAAEARCPSVLGPLNSLIPGNSNVSDLTTTANQVESALELAGKPGYTPAYDQLSSTLGKLGWTRSAPYNTVQHLLADGQQLGSLKPANLCSGLSTLVSDLEANGAATQSFVKRYVSEAKSLARAERSFLNTLQPDEKIGSAMLAAQVSSLQSRLAAAQRAVAAGDVSSVLSRLGVSS